MGLFDLFGKMTPEETEEHDKNWAWSNTSKWTDTHDAEGNELTSWRKAMGIFDPWDKNDDDKES